MTEMILGQPCPYCGEGSMICEGGAVGYYCDRGWDCKKLVPWRKRPALRKMLTNDHQYAVEFALTEADEIALLCGNVQELRARIKELEQEIEELKEQLWVARAVSAAYCGAYHEAISK